MIEVGAFEAKTHFSKLLDAVERGERVIITRRGKKVAEMGAPLTEEDERKRRHNLALANLSNLRKKMPAMSSDEILKLRDEGRKY